MIQTHAFARAGLVGNPSDGYFGKTLSVLIRDFCAWVRLEPADQFEIVPGESDYCRYSSPREFLRQRKLLGYYGGMRLLKAAVYKFFEHCRQRGVELNDAPFRLSYGSDIPRLVGLSGSSAIVCATMRALMAHYQVEIDKPVLPGLILAAEREELHINAGLQDRVIQVYEGIVYMDFSRPLLEQRGYGEYEPLTPKEMPPLYVAYDPERAEISDVTHRNLRQLFEQQDAAVVRAMREFAELAHQGRAAMLEGDWDRLHAITNANFNLRRSIIPIAPENLRMVETARSAGASAKFAGSGGAIIGVYHGENQYERLCGELAKIGCNVFKPRIFPEKTGA